MTRLASSIANRDALPVRVADVVTKDGATLVVWSDGLVQVSDGTVTRYLPAATAQALRAARLARIFTSAHVYAAVHWMGQSFRADANDYWILHHLTP